jgi:hypothetical protein
MPTQSRGHGTQRRIGWLENLEAIMPPPWLSSLLRPADAAWSGWFDGLAAQLLNGTQLIIADTPHRLVEVEAYYYGPGHLDPFTHRDPLQREPGRWYFHRSGGAYRGGSFKGLDLTFGDGSASCGVLLRSLARADGTLIVGPSLCVDHMLAATKLPTMKALDEAIAGRPAWDATSPLALVEALPARHDAIWPTARIGLALKRTTTHADGPAFICRPYRYLTEPRGVTKGKLHLALALHARGESVQRIVEITGSPRPSVQRYIADFEAGRQEVDFTRYFGAELSPTELAALHGTAHARCSGAPRAE